MNYNIHPETKLKWNNPTPQALIVRFYIAKLYYFIRAGNQPSGNLSIFIYCIALFHYPQII